MLFFLYFFIFSCKLIESKKARTQQQVRAFFHITGDDQMLFFHHVLHQTYTHHEGINRTASVRPNEVVREIHFAVGV